MNDLETAFASLREGQEIPSLTLSPVSRYELALFAGASGDHNPIHIDLDYARKAGMADVFAQGMLGMAWLGRLLTQWVPQAQLRRFQVRFTGITHLGHVLTCRGRVTRKSIENGENRVELEIENVNQYGEVKLAGTALVVLP